MPHAERVDGIVRATKPLSYGGTLIEGFALRFSEGRIVEATADRGETVLRQLVATDAGAGRLGELALVAHSTPVAQSGVLFYNTLFDENAASHIAVGSAYKFTLANGETMDNETFETGRRQSKRRARRFDDRIGGARRRRRSEGRHDRTAHALRANGRLRLGSDV